MFDWLIYHLTHWFIASSLYRITDSSIELRGDNDHDDDGDDDGDGDDDDDGDDFDGYVNDDVDGEEAKQ